MGLLDEAAVKSMEKLPNIEDDRVGYAGVAETVCRVFGVEDLLLDVDVSGVEGIAGKIEPLAGILEEIGSVGDDLLDFTRAVSYVGIYAYADLLRRFLQTGPIYELIDRYERDEAPRTDVSERVADVVSVLQDMPIEFITEPNYYVRKPNASHTTHYASSLEKEIVNCVSACALCASVALRVGVPRTDIRAVTSGSHMAILMKYSSESLIIMEPNTSSGAQNFILLTLPENLSFEQIDSNTLDMRTLFSSPLACFDDGYMFYEQLGIPQHAPIPVYANTLQVGPLEEGFIYGTLVNEVVSRLSVFWNKRVIPDQNTLDLIEFIYRLNPDESYIRSKMVHLYARSQGENTD